MNLKKKIELYKPIRDWLYKILGYFGVLLLSIISVLVVLQVTVRTFSDFIPFSLGWSQEISMFLYVILVVTGIPYASLRDEHISIRPLISKYAEGVYPYLVFISDILVAILFIIMAYSSYSLIAGHSETTLSTFSYLSHGDAYRYMTFVFIIGVLALVIYNLDILYKRLEVKHDK